MTKVGALWALGKGAYGKLGYNDDFDRPGPTLVEMQHFGHAKIVSAAAGVTHSAAVTEHGGLYIWGKGTQVGWNEEEEKFAGASGITTVRPSCFPCASALPC